MAEAGAAASSGLAEEPTGIRLSVPVQHVLSILLVAAAIKMPLGIPLYFNGLLLVIGLAALLTVQAVQAIFLWPAALLSLGTVWAAAIGVLPEAGPRLAQVALILCATSLLVRIEPALFARYLTLLLPVALVVLVAEPLLPEALYPARKLFGLSWPRAAGLHGEHNYNAMLMGAIGVILAQHRPKLLALVPFVVALTAISRGFLLALFVWLTVRSLGRLAVRLTPLALLILFSQPLVVLALDALAGDAVTAALDRISSSRFPLWVAYGEMGLSAPFGVGYWEGPGALARFDSSFVGLEGRDAHSIYLQVFGEFGWLGYLVFAGFIWHLASIVRHQAPEQLPVLLFVLTGYAFYDGLSDWAFWVPIGYILAVARRHREADRAAARELA